jgi:hypothetical protein
LCGICSVGKTTTIVKTVYQLGKGGKNVLLVALSNDAADVLVEQLALYFPPSKLHRILAYSRSLQSLPTTIRSYANEMLDAEAQKGGIMSACIVVSMVNLAAHLSYLGVSHGHFDVLCIDEAGHATEPEVIGIVPSLMDVSGDFPGHIILARSHYHIGSMPQVWYIRLRIWNGSQIAKSTVSKRMENIPWNSRQNWSRTMDPIIQLSSFLTKCFMIMNCNAAGLSWLRPTWQSGNISLFQDSQPSFMH